MSKRGLSRPGAIQMSVSLLLMVSSGIGPLIMAARRPSHEWFMALSGFPALAATVIGIAVVVLYIVGFFRYCSSKGYGKMLGLCLLLGSVPGLLGLLLLPDLKARTTSTVAGAKISCETPSV